jgi:hypothetical protein
VPRASLIESYQPFPPPEGVQAGFRHLNVEPGAVGLQ